MSGSKHAGAGASIAAAAEKVAREHITVTKIGPTKPIGKSIPKNKRLVYVNCGQPSCTIQEASFKEAASLLGWSVEDIAAEPTPQSIQAAFTEAIRRKPDGVASAAFGPALYSRQLKQLNEMHIPVIEATGEVESGEDGVAYDPIGPKTAADATRILADKTLADMGGEGEAGAIMLTGYPIVKTYTEAWEDEIKEKCKACGVQRLELQPTSIDQDAAEKITNFLRANPKIKAIFLSYDVLGDGLTSALKAAGVAEPLTYGWGLEAAGVESIRKGELTAGMPVPYNEVAWQQIDGFARIFTGENPIEPFQQPVIWSQEFGNLPAEMEPFPGIVENYQEQFKKLWGLS